MTVYDVVVVGGGNLGLWTAHRLARRGFGRIAVLERGWAGGGATSRSAGVVRQQGGSETAAKLGRLSRELYLRLGEELGLDSGFRETGYYFVAETKGRRKVSYGWSRCGGRRGSRTSGLSPRRADGAFPT